MNVKVLKEILKDLPDDMLIAIPNRCYEESRYYITNGCNLITTAGVLVTDEESGQVLCLNTSKDGENITDQIKDPFIICDKLLF